MAESWIPLLSPDIPSHVLVFRYMVCAKGILIIAHVASTPLKHCQKLISFPSALIIYSQVSYKCGCYGTWICRGIVGLRRRIFPPPFSSCVNKPCSFTDLPQLSMTGLQRTSRTHSCTSPTTAWTKRAAIMSGKSLQWSKYNVVLLREGSPSDSSIYYGWSVWSSFLSFQLRWPRSWGLWEQMEYECSAEVFEAGGEGHHMWVRPSPCSFHF